MRRSIYNRIRDYLRNESVSRGLPEREYRYLKKEDRWEYRARWHEEWHTIGTQKSVIDLMKESE